MQSKNKKRSSRHEFINVQLPHPLNTAEAAAAPGHMVRGLVLGDNHQEKDPREVDRNPAEEREPRTETATEDRTRAEMMALRIQGGEKVLRNRTARERSLAAEVRWGTAVGHMLGPERDRDWGRGRGRDRMGSPGGSWEPPGRDCSIPGDHHHRSRGPGYKVDMGGRRAEGAEHLGEAVRW